MNGGEPTEVAREAIEYLKRRLNGHGGLILLDARGRYGIAHNTPKMAWAVRTAEKEQVEIERK
jgi:beta-aspartyl-peptidase (threonine type)